MYSGAWDTIQGIISGIGISPETVQAVTRAFISPSLDNIHAVEAAFRTAGTSPPPELMNALYGRYGQAVKDNPYLTGGSALSTAKDWLLVVIALAARRRR